MDLRRADLGLLVSLDALLAARSVTGAARRLGISQPALSAQLARLRDLFGDDLLVGNAHGMTPTPRAEALAGRLRELLQELGALVAEGAAFDPARSDRRFRIAATDLEHGLLLPGLLAALRREAPGIRLALVPLEPASLAERMAQGAVDLAVSVERHLPECFPARRFGDDGFRVVWRRDHPRLGQAIDLDAFCAEGHLLVSTRGGGFHGVVDDALGAIGRSRRVVASLPSFLLVSSALQGCDLVAVVPSRLADLERDRLTSAELPVATDGFTLYLSWHPRHRNDPGHRWLRERLLAAPESPAPAS